MFMNYSFSSDLFDEEGEGSYKAYPGGGGGASGSGEWDMPCDSCRLASSAVHCRANAAYLCAACYARLQAPCCVCEACERALAGAVACRGDVVALCADCDVQVHSVNTLDRRQHCFRTCPLPAAAAAEAFCEKEPELEAAAAGSTWPLFNKNYFNNDGRDAGLIPCGEVDGYLNLTEYNYDPFYKQTQEDQQRPMSYNENESSEYVVPSQLQQHEASNTTESSYTASYSHVSFSSMEASAVPDTTMADISNSYLPHSKGTINLFSGPSLQLPLHFNTVDREARVLRYREKRKTRKFGKTIRYVSRKAYAESRPRIKGRFAKRSDLELKVDQMFSTIMIFDGNYGVVPLF